MKKFMVKKMAGILDNWGYKFSITKEDNTSIFIQSNIETHITPKKHLHINCKSNIGIGSIRPSAKFFQTDNNCVFKINDSDWRGLLAVN